MFFWVDPLNMTESSNLDWTWKTLVICFENCSDLLWQKKNCSKREKLLKIRGWRPKIYKSRDNYQGIRLLINYILFIFIFDHGASLTKLIIERLKFKLVEVDSGWMSKKRVYSGREFYYIMKGQVMSIRGCQMDIGCPKLPQFCKVNVRTGSMYK